MDAPANKRHQALRRIFEEATQKGADVIMLRNKANAQTRNYHWTKREIKRMTKEFIGIEGTGKLGNNIGLVVAFSHPLHR